MIEINSHNVDFAEDEFPTIGEIKRDVELYKLQQDIQPSFYEGEDLNSNQITKDGTPPISKRNEEDCCDFP